MRRQLLTVLSLSSGMDGDDVGAMEREQQADFDELQRQEDQREREQFGAQPGIDHDDEAPDVDDDGGDGGESPDDQGSESGSEGEKDDFDESEEEEDEFARAAADFDSAGEDDKAWRKETTRRKKKKLEGAAAAAAGPLGQPHPELSSFLSICTFHLMCSVRVCFVFFL